MTQKEGNNTLTSSALETFNSETLLLLIGRTSLCEALVRDLLELGVIA
jgi:hypothetical protein